jgi:hypothetical protein
MSHMMAGSGHATGGAEHHVAAEQNGSQADHGGQPAVGWAFIALAVLDSVLLWKKETMGSE